MASGLQGVLEAGQAPLILTTSPALVAASYPWCWASSEKSGNGDLPRITWLLQDEGRAQRLQFEFEKPGKMTILGELLRRQGNVKPELQNAVQPRKGAVYSYPGFRRQGHSHQALGQALAL